eukprot:4528364-Lingulodinium_polyedra.AAC.1
MTEAAQLKDLDRRPPGRQKVLRPERPQRCLSRPPRQEPRQHGCGDPLGLLPVETNGIAEIPDL